MQCRNCGIEIADKALICYRCGTATTEAKYQPHTSKAAGYRPVAVIVIVVLLLVLLAFFLLNSSGFLSNTSDLRPGVDQQSFIWLILT